MQQQAISVHLDRLMLVKIAWIRETVMLVKIAWIRETVPAKATDRIAIIAAASIYYIYIL
jgi:hypothetical protein